MRYKKINGKKATKKSIAEAEKKFPWLKDAEFQDAIIDTSKSLLVWINGIWEEGVWKGGIWKRGHWKGGIWKRGHWKVGWWMGGTWEEGVWKRGIWKGGIWKRGHWKGGWWMGGTWSDGIWEGGWMWSNLKQRYVKVKYENGKFKVIG